MSKIQEYLDKILKSKYGKDVRQSIADGIQQCYTDANGEAKVDIDQGKANSGKILGIGSDGMVQPVDQFSVGDDSVGTEKLKNAAVTTEKLGNGAVTKEKLDENLAKQIQKNTEDIEKIKEYGTLHLDENLTDDTKAAPAGMVGEVKKDLQLETERLDSLIGLSVFNPIRKK